MRKLAFLLLSIAVLISCNNAQKQNESQEAEQEGTEQAIGGDKDEHGCLTAAGETWSELLQSCVKVFEVGVRLNPTEAVEGEAVVSAFAVFNEDKSKVELFLPVESDEVVILEKAEGEVYQNDVYKFNAEEAALYVNDEVKFKAE